MIVSSRIIVIIIIDIIVIIIKSIPTATVVTFRSNWCNEQM